MRVCKKYLKPPWIETSLLISVLFLSYAGIALIALGAPCPEEGMSYTRISFLVSGFALVSFALSFLAAISGVGGGVLFTPVMLAFTFVDSLVIRAAGLLFAMFTGLTSTGPLMRKGSGNLKMCVFVASVYGTGAYGGAYSAVLMSEVLGDTGESAVRIALGLIVFGVAVYMFKGGRRHEWPDVAEPDRLSAWLNLAQPYYENSTGKLVNYMLHRAGPGIALIAFVGVISGFFGMGGAWAVVLAQTVVMGAPLKVSAANSLAVVGMGNCIAAWPYILGGAVVPLFVSPWLAGVVLGGRIGSVLLANVRASVIRFFLTGILFFTGFSLILRGLEITGIISVWRPANIAVLAMIILIVLRAALKDGNPPEYRENRDE